MTDPPSPAFASIDAYIAAAPADVRPRLTEVRATIRAAVPDAVEAIGYNIPAFKVHGRSFIYFSAAKHHVGLYPAPWNEPAFADIVARYGAGKGTLRFPHTGPLPVDVIRAVARYRADEAARLAGGRAGHPPSQGRP